MTELTRPIIGIENRTAQEVFDIMSDRIRSAAAREEGRRAPAVAGEVETVRRLLINLKSHLEHATALRIDPEDVAALETALASSPVQAEEGRRPAPVEGEVVTDEITEDAIRSKAKALLRHMGWKPGDKPGLHSVIELMTRFGVECRKITDRCAWPECGCDGDAVCAIAVEKRETAPPAPEAKDVDAVEQERLRRADAVITAARNMPRRTPAPGGCGTVHHFNIEAGAVWALDKALIEYDMAVLASPVPPEAKDVGEWVTWNGLERCPLAPGTRFQFRIRTGQEITDHKPEDHRWLHAGTDSDIIAYRVLAAAPPSTEGARAGEDSPWLAKAAYLMSEPHLSGYRVIIGFNTLNDAQDAQTSLSKAGREVAK